MKDFGEDIILVTLDDGFRFYQLIPSNGTLLAYRVGGALSGEVDRKRLQDPKKPLRSLEKNDRAFTIDETARAVFGEDLQKHAKYPNLIVRLRSTEGRCTLRCVYPSKENDARLQALIERVIPQCENLNTPSTGDRRRVLALRPVSIGLSIAAVLFIVLRLVFPALYRVFTPLLASIPLIILSLYCIFPNETTLSASKPVKKQQASFMVPLVLSCFIGARWESFQKYDIQSWGRYIFLAITVCLVLITITIYFNREWLRRRYILPILIICLMFYSAIAPAELNYTLDFSSPTQARTAIIEQMKVHERRKADDHYYITVLMSDGKQETLKIERKLYRNLDIGDTVKVEYYAGALGIPYATVDTPKEEP